MTGRRFAAVCTAIAAALLLACSSSNGVSPTPTASTAAVATTSAPDTPRPATSTPAALPPTPAAGFAPIPTREASIAGETVTISAVGDVSLARELVQRMETAGAGYPYELIAHLVDGDITFANLEGALTERGSPWPKGYTFRTPPRFAEGLRLFDVVSLANNHTVDFGLDGLLDTLGALDSAGVEYAGAGANDGAARAPAIVESNGLRVAFLAYAATPVESGGFAIEQWAAGPNAAGIAIASDAAIEADVAAARALADFVIVTAHAGTEYRNTPDATQARIVNAALAAGADAFIGHHAHVVQPVELRDGKLVAWGLGNFIFDLDNVDLANIPEPRVSLVLRFTLTKGSGVTSWQALPVVQDAAEDRPRPATVSEAAVLEQLLVP